ncbi:hypothetical protein [Nonomuraea turcica]|uniref:hypothetical protein n=1 Tax=Nonomuraea sp. G32 TaxID=3067274 RepID=UPI00273B76EF|nr:hypothetical protein [Nonomuraea sp. G32]MDP4502476.1 hypothetical protein [Nonomuraea sp. G32]
MRAVLAAVLATLTLLATGVGSAGAAPRRSALPGGKANFVISQGFLRAGSTQNWVRLGTYQFKANGTVSASTYLWWQRNPEGRQATGVVPDSSCSTKAGGSSSRVRACDVLTAGGFTGAPDESRTGTYSMAGNVVSIRWKIAQTWTEKWRVQLSPDGKLARLQFAAGTLATHGYGYGSNSSFATRRAMSSVRTFAGALRQDLVSWSGQRIVNSANQPFKPGAFRGCSTTTSCLTYLQPSSANACQKSGGCPNVGGGTKANISSIQYYLVKLSNNDRRDTMWHWCTCLAMERKQFCYSGNSHMKPLLQIIDDSGAFRGWVGAEASFYPGSGTRAKDMMAVFRITDFR